MYGVIAFFFQYKTFFMEVISTQMISQDFNR